MNPHVKTLEDFLTKVKKEKNLNPAFASGVITFLENERKTINNVIVKLDELENKARDVQNDCDYAYDKVDEARYAAESAMDYAITAKDNADDIEAEIQDIKDEFY
tara:strand:+ start:60 stop:374 length:315 start_codon:yes stop_codon:yes gene_type:complete